jgi:hypothetical protein
MSCISRVTFVILLVLVSSARAQEFSFVGRKPDLSGGKKLQVAKGVVPGVPVVFEALSPTQITLRPANPDERSNSDRATYRFERQKDKSILFYELIEPGLLERFDQQNAKDTASVEGKAYELSVVNVFFDGGETLRGCIPADAAARGTITAYIKVGATGKQEQAYVLPEGGVAQCIIEATHSRVYPAPKSPFVAKAAINVTE